MRLFDAAGAAGTEGSEGAAGAADAPPRCMVLADMTLRTICACPGIRCVAALGQGRAYKGANPLD